MPIRTFAVSLIGAAAVAAGFALLRQQKQDEGELRNEVPAGERVPATIVLERLRRAGI